MIHIRKIDIDQCSRTNDQPPLWAKVTASVNGIEVQVTLENEQAVTIQRAAETMVEQQLAKIKDVTRTVVEIRKPHTAA
jgi:cell division protein ZapA (FtsZ GTPase activity inhibitor)